jgi:two-component system sensor histidine kinase/response regulator
MIMTEEKLNVCIRELTILIIEDNKINTIVLESLLKENGIKNILIAKTGKEAIELFSEKVDLIFMDINLPDTDGLKLTHHFRNVFPKNDTPIICWSTIAESKRKECMEAGIDDFLSKPFSIEDLQEILECWLPSYRPEILKQTDPVLV